MHLQENTIFDLDLGYQARLGDKFLPRYLPVAFTGMENKAQVANSGKYDF